MTLSREQVENIIQDLDAQDIYRSTLEKALKYESTGVASTYINVRTGEVSTTWDSQGEHEDGTFYIILCSIDTPIDVEGIDDIEAQVDYWVEDAQLRTDIKYQLDQMDLPVGKPIIKLKIVDYYLTTMDVQYNGEVNPISEIVLKSSSLTRDLQNILDKRGLLTDRIWGDFHLMSYYRLTRDELDALCSIVYHYYVGDKPLSNVIGTQEAGELWGLSADRIKTLCADGTIRSKKIGNTWVIDRNQPNPRTQS